MNRVYDNLQMSICFEIERSNQDIVINTFLTARDPKLEAFIEEYTPLLNYFARINITAHLSYEDLVQLGRLALLRAYQTYDINRGAKLSTWAYECVKNEMSHIKRGYKKLYKESVSLDDDYEAENIYNGKPSTNPFENINNKLFLKQLFKALSPDERELLVLRHVQGLKVYEIAEQRNVSANYITRCITNAERKARNRAKILERN